MGDMISLALVLATLLTSIISGVLSMAGGMILMGVFGFFLTVPAAMVLHGVAQACSNGSRVWLYRHHLKWQVLGYYSIGAFLVLGVFTMLSIVPSVGLVFILIGSFPFIALAMPKSIDLNMEKAPVAFSSGILVTLAQMLAGASGPVLDIFYVKSDMTKEEILGTKAVTQTLGHLLKLAYYLVILSVGTTQIAWWLIPAVVAAAIGGNYAATFIVQRMSDQQFKQIGRWVIMVIGLIYIAKGVIELV